MKKISKYLKQARKLVIAPVLVAALMVSSCEEIIDLKPYSSIDENSAFSTPSLVELSVMGMYAAAQRGFYDGAYRGYPFGAAFVQQGDARGEDAVNIFTFYQLTYTATYGNTSANNVWWWSDSYRLINRANIILDGVQKAADAGIITQDKANEYKGEALMFRAMAHFEMLLHFARPYKDTPTASHFGIPYREVPVTTQTAIDASMAQGRNSVAECYSKALADLNQAEAWLPLKATRGAGKPQVVRSTKQAAAAYKSRVYLHMWDMPNVIAEGAKFQTGGAYAGTVALQAQPEGAFVNNFTTESVFSLEQSGTNNPGVNAALASQYKRRLLVCVSPIIWRHPSWRLDDKRRSETTTTQVSNHMIFSSSGVKYTYKYKDETNYSDASPLIRYAEVVLNLAEAHARQSTVAGDANFTSALTYLNMVRNRALADPGTQAYVAADFATPVALLGAILDEERIEFVMEGRRWPNIHRLQFCPHFPINGIPGKMANANPGAAAFTLGTPYTGALGVAAIPYSDYRFVWPLPLDEINANPTLAAQQNPGY